MKWLKILLYLVFALAVATRVYALLEIKTFYHADEVYQFLEQAYKLTYGYGMTPWEYTVGVRSWFYPMILHVIYGVAIALGFAGASPLIFSARILSVVCSLALVYLTYLIGRGFYSKRVGVFAALFSAASLNLIVFSPAVLSEIPATLFSTASVYLLYRGFSKEDKQKCFFAGLLMGVSFMFRFANAVLLPPMILFLLYFKRTRAIAVFAFGFLVVVFAQGVLDYFTWGSFLASPINYLKFNVIEGGSSFFGTQPYYFYIAIVAMDFLPLLFLAYSIGKRHETVYLYLVAGFYFIAFSLLPHKEQRFMFAILPFYHTLGALGFDNALRGFSEKQQLIVVFVLFAMSSVFVVGIIHYHDWTEFEPMINAFEFVGRQNDSTGVAYSTYWWSYTLLHKRMPMYPLPTPIECSGMLIEPANAGISLLPPNPIKESVDEILSDPEVNYVVTCDAHLELFGEDLDELGYRQVREFGDGIYVYRR